MSGWLLFAIFGTGAGALYAALAISMVITYRASGVVNFAQITMATYPAFEFVGLRNRGELTIPFLPWHQPIHFAHPWSFWPSFLVAMAVAALTGVMIGTGAGNPGRKHVAIEGDGSLMFNIQEFETIVRHGLNITLVVWNDAGYGAEVHKLVAKGFNEKLAQWDSPNFVAIAKAFGGDGVLLDKPENIGAAIQEGMRKGGLYVIDARVSPSTPTDPYAKVYFGTVSQAPLLRPAV